jgi:hypothetical protein
MTGCKLHEAGLYPELEFGAPCAILPNQVLNIYAGSVIIISNSRQLGLLWLANYRGWQESYRGGNGIRIASNISVRSAHLDHHEVERLRGVNKTKLPIMRAMSIFASIALRSYVAPCPFGRRRATQYQRSALAMRLAGDFGCPAAGHFIGVSGCPLHKGYAHAHEGP